jgi:hypothetical protein
MTAAAHTVADEPISPELALVCPELRALAVDALDAAEEPASEFADLWRLVDDAGDEEEAAEVRPARRLSVQLAVYAGMQIVIGVLVGVAAVTTVTVALIGLMLVTH